MKIAAIYARVSSDKQKGEGTIASQTAALLEFAKNQGYEVPDEWVFEDNGYSGANLVRPGLEQVRDLAAQRQIQAVLAHSPDRLSRKYAYQVLLTEELARCGVEMVFIKTPQSDTPEDQLLLQFQGMIAEYERAQILERSRRGKLHRAKQGHVSVLGKAPYGYRYMKKNDEMPAHYEIIETEAEVVRIIFDFYTSEGLSINAITRKLSELGYLTRKGKAQWERSSIWGMLCNPAYKGTACFGKSCVAPRKQIKATRSVRLKGGILREHTNMRLPREQWIEIPVPALVSEDTFVLAQELFLQNKKHSARRTTAFSVLQNLVCCRKCSYAWIRATNSSGIRYYHCTGRHAWRHSGKVLCDQKPIRQDFLDDIVWREVISLLEDPTLIQAELDRRLEMARNGSSTKHQQETLVLELTKVQKSMERLLTAYQEELLSLDELRNRLPEQRQREQLLKGELQSINSQIADREAYLKLAETLSSFLERLRMNAETLDILERQKIVRLLVREVFVDDHSVTIRHSIPLKRSPMRAEPSNPSTIPHKGENANSNQLLCSDRIASARGEAP